MSCCGNCGYDKDVELKRTLLTHKALKEIWYALATMSYNAHADVQHQLSPDCNLEALGDVMDALRDTLFTYKEKGDHNHELHRWVLENTSGWWEPDNYCFPEFKDLDKFQKFKRHLIKKSYQEARKKDISP